jgi:hypothetical protein
MLLVLEAHIVVDFVLVTIVFEEPGTKSGHVRGQFANRPTATRTFLDEDFEFDVGVSEEFIQFVDVVFEGKVKFDGMGHGSSSLVIDTI